MIYLEGASCYLRTLNVKDAPALANLVYDNKLYWSVFEPLHQEEYYTASVQREKIRESLMLMQERREYSFGIFTRDRDTLIGSISLYSLKRSIPFFQNASFVMSSCKCFIAKSSTDITAVSCNKAIYFSSKPDPSSFAFA